ncbi:hypothetical protein NLK61_25060 [Pseudomonas fuscovaginae UPB0736]|uniref:Uncharacterized protein n=1 Tax=Pseudomonas asplenii TaxID=53407 RepID=A0A1H1XA33_9PSED|nr:MULTISPECIES: hypothetical protein [Pseudomonas]UUQ64441.1 hypothetical protein NLK61_25060 [Pseudomonas fuscovaginae UPB0736]SDT06178.1 hypothetical protein SAMN05216598_3811 [Pseudomonas asplenii]SEI22041.1 hypothetical protein SAMN05216581_4692 [Pseudomonas fuscovaginae]
MNRRANNQKTTKTRWLAATERSNHLFKEAARLDDEAYDLLSDGVVTSDTLEKFRLAKAAAAAKYAQARKAWEQAREAFQEQTE